MLYRLVKTFAFLLSATSFHAGAQSQSPYNVVISGTPNKHTVCYKGFRVQEVCSKPTADYNKAHKLGLQIQEGLFARSKLPKQGFDVGETYDNAKSVICDPTENAVSQNSKALKEYKHTFIQRCDPKSPSPAVDCPKANKAISDFEKSAREIDEKHKKLCAPSSRQQKLSEGAAPTTAS